MSESGTPPKSEPTPGERWVGFLRGYGPANRVDGMFAESTAGHAAAHGTEPLLFIHPTTATLDQALDPLTGRLTNVVLTGTAGDGKTTLCNDLWARFGGGAERQTGRHRGNYLPLEVETPTGRRTIHFIFEFSAWCPQTLPWPDDKLDLLNRFAHSMTEADPAEIFIIAANDGKLVQAWDGLPEGSPAASFGAMLEDLLATDRQSAPGLNLLFLNLSRMPTTAVLEQALRCLLDRVEWRCLEDEADDPAFGPASPFFRNFRLLSDPSIRARLLAIAELLDANGLHIPIREVLLLLVNGLLGWSGAQDGLATVEELRQLAREDRAHEATLYGNLFGANLTERRREHSAVFRHLGGFRIGRETTNALDGLLIFGAADPTLQAEHERFLASDPYYGSNAKFDEMRIAYLEAEDERVEQAQAFLAALVNERRRLFFRLPESSGRLDPWKLSVFHAAGTYRAQVLHRLRAGQPVDPGVLKRLVCGFNRIWTGMLVAEMDKLYLSTGLDLSTARVSDIFLYEAAIQRSIHGDEVGVALGEDRIPVLRVSLGGPQHSTTFKLHLTRYEFLMRVAQGALPGSFSKECNEDVLAFKSQVLSQYYALVGDRPAPIAILSLSAEGTLHSRQLSVTL
ncbi:hypothetical protein [Mesorhizobium sp.]|uniref:hypothetical protein n=1 Tax=Mesorhizobium sp. TaxID=1871066 RepID=UPI00122995F5|nr:hypothetical protein [Mesorhizobium sp.]TIL65604.1 MAG: hypothetical protein E5Y77_20685 [Mesorhizobium sp.]